MRCSKCRKLYDDAVSGLLPEKTARKVREHLAQCPSCAVFWQENDALRMLLRESCEGVELPAPAYFARLSRIAVAKSADYKPSAKPAAPSLGWGERIAASVAALRLGALARAAVFVALGALAGFLLSSHRFDRTKGTPEISGPPGAVREIVPAAEVADVIKPITIKPASTPSPADFSKALASLGPHAPSAELALPTEQGSPLPARPPMKIEPEEKPAAPKVNLVEASNQPGPTVDPNLVVKAWEQTVSLLNKLGPSDEIERLRKIQQVSRQVEATTVLNSLQDLKIQLVRSGKTEYIPIVHRIEELLNELAAASPENEGAYFAHLDTYQEAERALIEKRYDDAMRLFKMVVIQAPRSYLATRARYQMGNINFEYYRDYKNALFEYNQCLNQSAPHFLDQQILDQMHQRVELITQNAVDDYAPLKIFYEAESKQNPADAIELYAALLDKYPQSPLAKKAIERITRLVCQNTDDESLVAPAIDILERFQDKNPDNPAEIYAELGVADITRYRIRNRAQAILEYSKILEKAKDPTLIRQVRARLRQLDRER